MLARVARCVLFRHNPPINFHPPGYCHTHHLLLHGSEGRHKTCGGPALAVPGGKPLSHPFVSVRSARLVPARQFLFGSEPAHGPPRSSICLFTILPTCNSNGLQHEGSESPQSTPSIDPQSTLTKDKSTFDKKRSAPPLPCKLSPPASIASSDSNYQSRTASTPGTPSSSPAPPPPSTHPSPTPRRPHQFHRQSDEAMGRLLSPLSSSRGSSTGGVS